MFIGVVNFNREHRTIQSFDETECWQRFRTRKADLIRLRVCLKLDFENIRAENGNIHPVILIVLVQN